MTLKKDFPLLARFMPDLLKIKSGSLLPFAAPPETREMGLTDDNGLTRKGERVLDHLLALAELLDIPYA